MLQQGGQGQQVGVKALGLGMCWAGLGLLLMREGLVEVRGNDMGE